MRASHGHVRWLCLYMLLLDTCLPVLSAPLPIESLARAGKAVSYVQGDHHHDFAPRPKRGLEMPVTRKGKEASEGLSSSDTLHDRPLSTGAGSDNLDPGTQLPFFKQHGSSWLHPDVKRRIRNPENTEYPKDLTPKTFYSDGWKSLGGVGLMPGEIVTMSRKPHASAAPAPHQSTAGTSTAQSHRPNMLGKLWYGQDWLPGHGVPERIDGDPHDRQAGAQSPLHPSASTRHGGTRDDSTSKGPQAGQAGGAARTDKGAEASMPQSNPVRSGESFHPQRIDKSAATVEGRASGKAKGDQLAALLRSLGPRRPLGSVPKAVETQIMTSVLGRDQKTKLEAVPQDSSMAFPSKADLDRKKHRQFLMSLWEKPGKSSALDKILFENEKIRDRLRDDAMIPLPPVLEQRKPKWKATLQRAKALLKGTSSKERAKAKEAAEQERNRRAQEEVAQSRREQVRLLTAVRNDVPVHHSDVAHRGPALRPIAEEGSSQSRPEPLFPIGWDKIGDADWEDMYEDAVERELAIERPHVLWSAYHADVWTQTDRDRELVRQRHTSEYADKKAALLNEMTTGPKVSGRELAEEMGWSYGDAPRSTPRPKLRGPPPKSTKSLLKTLNPWSNRRSQEQAVSPADSGQSSGKAASVRSERADHDARVDRSRAR